jgi:hypothetical protein
LKPKPNLNKYSKFKKLNNLAELMRQQKHHAATSGNKRQQAATSGNKRQQAATSGNKRQQAATSGNRSGRMTEPCGNKRQQVDTLESVPSHEIRSSLNFKP